MIPIHRSRSFAVLAVLLSAGAGLLLLAGCPRNRPPDAPETPAGSSSGFVDSTYTFSIVTTDPDGDSVSYRFAWGQGETTDWSGPLASGLAAVESHVWSQVGTYVVVGQAQDVLGSESPWSDALSVAIWPYPNDPPTLPQLRGPDTTRERIAATYRTWAWDPDHDSLQIRVAWGDGDTSDWSELLEPDRQTEFEHAWQTEGQYVLRAQARDTLGAESGWSEGLDVSVVAVPYPYRRVATFALEPSPDGIVVTPDGNHLYVGMDDSTVAVIRTTDYEEVTRVRVSANPCRVAMLPNGEYVYAASYEGWAVSVVRTADNAVVATITDLKGPIDIAVLPDGKRVYVSCRMDNTVAVISTETNQVIRRVPIGSDRRPDQIAVAPDGEHVYVATRRRFVVIRTADDSVIARVTYGGSIRDLMVTQDGGYLYGTCTSGWIAVYGLPELTLEREIPGDEGFAPSDFGALSDGQHVYVGALGESQSLVMRTADHTVVDTLAVAGVTSCIAVAPDGERVYLTHFSRDSVTVLGY